MERFEYYLTEFGGNDLCRFSRKYSDDDIATKFMLVRSLDKEHLKEILDSQNASINSNDIKALWNAVFALDLSIGFYIEYIQRKKPELVEKRLEEISSLDEILRDFGDVQCGIRNDDINSLVSQLVRDKSLQSIEQLNQRITEEYLPRIENYIRWSYYNQVAGDIIEYSFISHPRILPTLRKIPNIDFFLICGDRLLPFDLKVTHVADGFFDDFSTGLYQTDPGCSDSYQIGEDNSEIKDIKEFYRAHKRNWSLPNYGGLKKTEILEIIESVGNQESKQFIASCLERRAEIVSRIKDNQASLEWWNYKNQGERLFENNNRFFVFLAYENSFEDARELKGHIDELSSLIEDTLTSIEDSDFNSIRYYYTKRADLIGEYEARSASIMYSALK